MTGLFDMMRPPLPATAHAALLRPRWLERIAIAGCRRCRTRGFGRRHARYDLHSFGDARSFDLRLLSVGETRADAHRRELSVRVDRPDPRGLWTRSRVRATRRSEPRTRRR